MTMMRRSTPTIGDKLQDPMRYEGRRDGQEQGERAHQHQPARHADYARKKRRNQRGEDDGRADRSGHHSALTASSTSAAWPFTLTFGHTRTIRPPASARKVARAIPIYRRP